jgi:hypothetical protein
MTIFSFPGGIDTNSPVKVIDISEEHAAIILRSLRAKEFFSGRLQILR